mgnify:FL=1
MTKLLDTEIWNNPEEEKSIERDFGIHEQKGENTYETLRPRPRYAG